MAVPGLILGFASVLETAFTIGVIALFGGHREPAQLVFDSGGLLQVLDLPLADSDSLTERVSLRMIRRDGNNQEMQRIRADIETALISLPHRQSQGVRIYLEHDLQLANHGLLLPDSFDDGTNKAQTIRSAYNRWSRGGYYGLSVQWTGLVPVSWYEATSFLIHSKEVQGRTEYGLMTGIKRVCVLEHEDGCFTLLISSRTYNCAGFSGMHRVSVYDDSAAAVVVDSMKKFSSELVQFQNQYRPILSGIEQNNSKAKKQVLLLWFSHVQLVHLLEFMQSAKLAYLRLRESKVDSRTSELLPQLLDEVIQDAHLFRELSVIAEDFSLETESLIKSASVNFGPEVLGFRSLAEDLRGLSSELRQKGLQLPRYLDHHLKYLEMRRNMRESSGLWMLTVLASIFLPLSLACGILSMQTRLRDLHTLLYDFVGVVVLLLTFAGLVLVLVKALMTVSEMLASRTQPLDRLKTMLVKTCSAITVGSFWAIVLTSFIVGMVKDVYLGGIILGYGMAAFVSIGVLLGAVIWLLQSIF